MSSIDYSAIALITIFTSFFAGLGQELAKEIINRLKEGHKKLKQKNGIRQEPGCHQPETAETRIQ